MSIPIKFFTFAKKTNSTKRPVADSGVTYQCNFIDGTNMLSPEITISGENADFNPRMWNYAFIDTFDRYYFINNWAYYRGLWSASLECDTLASWKNGIGNSVEYITRSGNELLKNSGSKFQDSQYPAEVLEHSQKIDYSEPIGGSYMAGTIILGVWGDSESKFGAAYYAFLPSTFLSFITTLFSDNIWVQMLNSLTEPLKYIVSCKWVPLDYTEFKNDVQVGGIYFGNYAVPITTGGLCYKITDSIKTVEREFELSQNPFISHGSFISTNPYTTRYFYWAPMGDVQIDTSILGTNTGVKLRLYIDTVTGQAIFDLRTPDMSGVAGNIIAKGTGKCAVELPISQITVDALGTAGGVISAATNAFAGNAAGFASSLVSMGGSLIPHVSHIGGNGSFASYFKSQPSIISDFFRPANIYPEKLGYFTGGIYDTISNYPGFLKIENPSPELNATQEETEKIKNFMTGGFYFE